MADYIDRKADRILAPPPDYPIREVSEKAFIASRYGMAKALVKQIDPKMRLSACATGFQYVHAGGANAGDAPEALQLAWPRKLFGIEAVDGDLVDELLL